MVYRLAIQIAGKMSTQSLTTVVEKVQSTRDFYQGSFIALPAKLIHSTQTRTTICVIAHFPDQFMRS